MRKMKSEGWRPAASAALPGFTVLTLKRKKYEKNLDFSAFVDSCIKKHQLVKQPPKNVVKLEPEFPKIN